MLSEKYIKATNEYCTYEKTVHAPYLRKTFELPEIPNHASLTMTCTGFYRVFVNGTEITNGRLAPGITNPDQIIFYDEYDLIPFLQKGKNCLAFWLGNGISNCMGGYIWDFEKAKFRSAPKLAVSFESDILQFEADESFLCADSPVLFDDLRCGEHYDATLKREGWNLPQFDDSDWKPAIIADPPRGNYALNQNDPVVITRELRAVEIAEGRIIQCDPSRVRPASYELSQTTFYQPEKGERGFIFKFDENLSSVPRLRIKGRPGQTVIIQAAEYCDENNQLAFENIQSFYPFGFCQRDIYICKGGELEEYIPSFTYHGARYYMLIGADKEQISEDTLTMLVLHSDIHERGNFSCSDRIANKLMHMGRNSDLANLVHFPTDCPHREKNGWTADAAVSAEHMLQTLTVERIYRQWLKMICRAQRSDGMLPGIVPTSGWGFKWGNGPAWDQVIVELPYQVYIYRGDITLFEECADAVMRYLNYLSRQRSENGTLEIGLGDWCQAGRSEANHFCPTCVTDTAVSYQICRKAELLFEACGAGLQASFARNLGDELYQAFRKNFVDFDSMTVYGTCQTAQAVAISYGLLTPGEQAAAYQALLKLIHDADDHIACGVIGLRVIFRLLAKHGDAELAYRMITRTDGISYGMWAEKFQLRSFAEMFWPEIYPLRGSLNHHFHGDITGFFIAHIAGLQVNPNRNDAKCVQVAPNFIEHLDHASAYYDTVAGRIDVEWKRVDGKIILTVSKPDDVYGNVVLPAGYQFTSKLNRSDTTMHGRRVYALETTTYTIGHIST